MALATLQARCDSPPCTYGGEANTLTANTVTTTIVSTTSVPCYITTYLTDSTTTTSTVYSTDIITSTITEKGTVTVVQYQPTPVLMSSTYESVEEITHTSTTFWTETEGSAHAETQTGSVETIGGGTAGGEVEGCCGAGKGTNVQISTASAINTAATVTATGAASAWTHATGTAANLQATTLGQVAAGGGWANAAGGGGATSVGTSAAGAGVAVNWNAGGMTRGDVSSFIVAAWAVGVVLLFGVCHYLG